MTTPNLKQPANPQVQRLDQLTNWLLVGLLFVPFAISFGALRHLAETNGMSYPVFYPFMIDGGLIIFKSLALRASLRGKQDNYAWGMAISLTIISVALNIVHVPASLPTLWLARFMAALPPLVILAAFVAVSRRIEETARQTTAITTYSQLLQAIRSKEAELKELIHTRTTELDTLITKRRTVLTRLQEQRTTLETELERLTAEIDTLRTEKRTLKRQSKTNKKPAKTPTSPTTDPQTAYNDLLLYLTTHPTATLAEIGQAISRSKSTAGKYTQNLIASGRLSKNGQEWQVMNGTQ